MSVEKESSSPVRDLSPKRQNSSKFSNKKIQPKRSLQDKVVKWLGTRGRATIVRGGAGWGTTVISWVTHEKKISDYIETYFPSAAGQFPYFIVILYFVHELYLWRPHSHFCDELSVLLTRVLGTTQTKAVHKLCKKLEKYIVKLGLAGSPFWRQLNDHIEKGSSWAKKTKDGYVVTHGTRNFVNTDPWEPVGYRPMAGVIGGVDPMTLANCSKKIDNEEAVRKLVQEDKQGVEDTTLTSSQRARHEHGLSVYAERLAQAQVCRAQIEDYIAKRLEHIVPFFDVALPTFSGESRLFSGLAKLEDALDGYENIELIEEGHIIRAKYAQ